MKNERFEMVEDLINSDLFCEWVQHQQHKTFWQEWQADNAARKALIAEARAFIHQLSFEREMASEVEIAEAMTSLWSGIKKQQQATSRIIGNKQTQLFTLSKRWRVAASILFLIAASWLTWQYTANDITTYRTAYGETETLTLPDGSQVVLQANSSLKVPKNWAEKSTRTVWLAGQAFFNVTKLERKTPIKFIVQTDDFKVEVLGTEFDVLNRTNNKRVILQEGRVRMQLSDNQSINLQPNEMVAYTDKTKKYKKSIIEATNFTAWTNDQLILNQTPLTEIARILTDNYGFEVRFSASVNQGEVRNSVGALPINNVDDLITIIEGSYEVNITKNGQHIIIQ